MTDRLETTEGNSIAAPPPRIDAYMSAREAMLRLLALLDDPHPGLATWCGSVARARLAVIEELEG